ncbi:MAG TPA: hypothetical protein VJT50_05830, partial [Pyrinomonadaceae bacterium]|nr:hypothetical protein [Pyrinomonadaceae bacterium]
NLAKWFAFVLVMFVAGFSAAAQSAEESAVRGVVQQVFSQLQSHDYASIYDSLPSSTRTRVSKSNFVNALQRAQDRYSLDRIDIGRVRVSGDLAVVDTELFGRISQPLTAEGKIVVQQYLIREGGKWRVATGDSGTIQRFLKSNPKFARQFPIRQARIFIKQNNNWVEFRAPRM